MQSFLTHTCYKQSPQKAGDRAVMPPERPEKIHIDSGSINNCIEGNAYQQVLRRRCLHMQQDQHKRYGEVSASKGYIFSTFFILLADLYDQTLYKHSATCTRKWLSTSTATFVGAYGEFQEILSVKEIKCT